MNNVEGIGKQFDVCDQGR